MDRGVDNILPGSTNFDVVGSFELTISHVVIFHWHERGIGICFWIRSARASDAFFSLVFAKFWAPLFFHKTFCLFQGPIFWVSSQMLINTSYCLVHHHRVDLSWCW